jgi:hypothetical protein
MDSLESKKLKDILLKMETENEMALKSADDMKAVHQAQAKLRLIEELTTQFFTENKPPNDHTTLRL